MKGRLPLLLLLPLLGLAPPATPETVLRYDFEEDAAGWTSQFPGATLRSSSEHARSGRSSLEVSYTLNATASPAFQVAPEQSAPGARSVRFWIRSSAATPLQFALSERDRSGYYYALQLPANDWVHVALPFTSLNRSPAATDENDRFDPEQLGLIRFQDVSRYHSSPDLLGPRTLWLDRLEFSTDRAPGRNETRTFDRGRGLTLDNFDAEFLSWEVASTVRAGAAETGGRGVARLVYRQVPSSPPPDVLTHVEGARFLAGMEGLRIVLRSERATQLRLSMLEYLPDYRSVPYEASLEVPPGRDWRVVYLTLADFRPAGGAQDADGRFDSEKVWMVRLVDGQTGDQENTLEIDEIAVIRGKTVGE